MRAITAGMTPIAWITPSRAAVAGRLRRIRLEIARVAAVAPRTRLSSKGRRAERIRLRTSGSTSIDSASLIGPRRPGTLATRPGTSSGLRSEATSIEPSGRRTAAAQWVGPWTSRPLRRAMPPSRSFFAFAFPRPPPWQQTLRDADSGRVDDKQRGRRVKGPGALSPLFLCRPEAPSPSLRPVLRLSLASLESRTIENPVRGEKLRSVQGLPRRLRSSARRSPKAFSRPLPVGS